MNRTFERSMEHWSEAGRLGMDAFYQVATKDYRLLAEAWDWTGCIDALPQRRVLDVACGSGKFPAALVEHTALGRDAGHSAAIQLDLLDPSAFSIEETAGALRHPFRPGERLCLKLQDLQAEPYPLLWAMHGLYAVPKAELEHAMQRLLAARASGGLGVIAQARRHAHYVRFHDLYVGGGGEGYTAAEDLLEVLESFGANVEVRDLDYDGVIDAGRDDVAEGYLQRCLFDDTRTLAELLDDAVLGPYLRGCRTDEGGWRFRQRVAMIFIRD